ncbi:enoyl-CoA hydratase-related protein [Candidatus Berkiella aquae]|uniref:Enoyl-CoA hydratase/isomerase family protein n=1 Tax=Candidatus Berkiella aquae TaxID=295108 RepID=A0A0Q9Z1Q5_9GAMM|nr:enoyl-CoA hydratase/isomerase family protein [Candidatus Berkiella aquae]MCS5712396.1 enoyl-CoA hydratase/isomerase family protein [Candidatus Berkiella aquae]
MTVQDTILVEKNQHGVATLTLNRPQVHNAFNETMIAQMTESLHQLAIDHSVRILVLKSTGKHFSAGADLAWMRKMMQYDATANFQDALALGKLMYHLHHFPKPTLAIVQGNAYGGGAGLIACCHIAITASIAEFCFSEVKLGLIPAVISPYVIQAIGQRHARAYFLSANTFNAATALQMGLCHEVVAIEELETKAHEMITRLLQNGPHALQAVNQLMNHLQTPSIDEDLVHMTAKTIAMLRISPEGQEGLNAFLEKREPSWVKTR